MKTNSLYMLLKSKAITQTELAKAIGVSTRAIQDWLTGYHRPSEKHLKKMSEILNVPIESLVDLPNGFSAKLRRLINGTGMTREEFAEKINTSNASVYNWLNGAMPTPRKLKQIADFFNISVSSLTDEQCNSGSGCSDLQSLITPALISGLAQYGQSNSNQNAIEAAKYLALLYVGFQPKK